ncbi:MAG: type I-E CRISPR-associated protein Cas7/Cse4/CasC [Dermatophilaceae bacterium]
MNPLYVDFHILQDLPPSNVNRDDNGTPKQAIYGGATRLRVSSQSWKRATRTAFTDPGGVPDGVRTRRLETLVSEALTLRGVETETALAATRAALGQLGIKPGKKESQSSYLLFCGRRQLDQVADDLATSLAGGLTPEDAATSVDVKAVLGQGHSLDVALFGRMVADVTDLNVDAALQVAHALSTHAAPTQFDYFTAVDDLQERDEAGAGMIGTVEFNSATMYRFATVAVHQLAENLAGWDAAADGVATFTRAFALSMPTGHQNSFAARTRPATVAVVIRGDQPVSLVSAFESPVRANGAGVMEQSQQRLAALFTSEVQRWGDVPLLAVASYAASESAGEALAGAFGPSADFSALVERVTESVRSAGAAR